MHHQWRFQKYMCLPKQPCLINYVVKTLNVPLISVYKICGLKPFLASTILIDHFV